MNTALVSKTAIKTGSLVNQCMRCAHFLSRSVSTPHHHITTPKSLKELMQILISSHFSSNVCSSCGKYLSVMGLKARQMKGVSSWSSPGSCNRSKSTTASHWKDTVEFTSLHLQEKLHLLNEPGYYPARNGEITTDLKRFLSEVGTDPREARYWLKQFKDSELTRPFALVQLDPEVFNDIHQVENFASCISFLHRNSMKPVVVVGNPLDDRSHLNPEQLRQMRAKLMANCMVLTSLLEMNGIQARPLFSGSNVLHASQPFSDTLGGTITGVNRDPIKWCLHTKHVPIIPAVGETAGGQILALDLWHATEELAKALEPLKIMKINTTGGLFDEEGHVIPNVNIPADLTSEKPWCTPDIRSRIQRISDLLYKLPIQSSVVITSVDRMLQELFTHRGCGTFFKITEPILKYKNFHDVDIERLHDLLNKAFSKELQDDYFDKVRDSVYAVYLSQEYSAAAIILLDKDVGIPYLDKFAVSLKAQGEGTGEMLWESLRSEYTKLFWRSQGDNAINPWYFKKSEGSWSNGKWTVFWYGVPQHSLMSNIIDYALEKPPSFLENAASKPQTG